MAIERSTALPCRTGVRCAQALGEDGGEVFREAVRCHQGGRLAEAERLYEQVLDADSGHAESLHQLGLIATQRGLYSRGLELIRKAIGIAGGSARYYVNQGTTLRYLGRLREARESFEQAITLESAYAQAHNHLGTVLWELGGVEEAEKCFRKAVRLRPDYGDAHNNLGNLLRENARLEDALESYRRALEVTPLGHPKAAIYNCNLGAALREAGQLSAALDSFTRALAIQPEDTNAHYCTGLTLRDLGRLQEAELSFRRALALDPLRAETSSDLGVTLRQLGQLDPAETYFRRAIHLAANRGDGYCGLGTVLLERGRLTEAEHQLECALALEPKNALFHYNLSAVKRYSKRDPAFERLESQLKDIEQRPTQEKIYLRFALGKAYEDVGELKPAFEQFVRGNALKRAATPYDEAHTLGKLEKIAEVFTAEYLRAHAEQAAPADGPIFIVGMLRSGSTLVEQILASHSQVHGAGEVHAFEGAVTTVLGKGAYPEALRRLSAENLGDLARRYECEIRADVPPGVRVTDKLLGNFLYCGLIPLVFPGARIIHTRRDPIDTCLSCFSKLFLGHHPYAYDLAELGRYYRAYERLMEHWRRILPPGVMIEIDYEEVVADTEIQARRILEHCGLPWEESCLDFHKLDRPVRTASAVQVRKPIYGTSIRRWQPIEALLTPLTDELRSAKKPE